MSFVGATLAATSVALFVLGVLPRSRVAARLSALGRPGTNLFGRLRGVRVMAPATLRASGLSIAIEQVVAAKIALALVGALLAAVVALLVPIGPLVIAAARRSERLRRSSSGHTRSCCPVGPWTPR